MPPNAARSPTPGRKSIKRLLDREYFINLIDTKHPEALNSGTGCEIDQVFGQSWAYQVGLDRVIPQKETRLALHALWRYNFTPDCGAYRKIHKGGRWFALAGEAGMLMCTFPRKDWSFENASGKGNTDGCCNLLNEVMNGFDYQVAGHMIWEGMVQHGLAVTRAVHDRHHPSKRNPWNEVECGDTIRAAWPVMGSAPMSWTRPGNSTRSTPTRSARGTQIRGPQSENQRRRRGLVRNAIN